MISNPQLYDTWRKQLQQLTPDKCESRLTNMILLVVGLYLAHSVHLTLIARKLPIRVQKLSLDKRLRRFLSNHAIRPRAWYHPVATMLVRAASSGGQVHLIIDCSKVSAGHQLLIVGIAYRRRALPLAWTWVRCPKGHSTTRKQIALLGYVRTFFPLNVNVSLVGDCEFGRPLLLEYLDWWDWDYALRQPCNHLVMTRKAPIWRRLDSFALQPGATVWLEHVVLTRNSSYPTNLVLHWGKGGKSPWYLATNHAKPRPALRLYRCDLSFFRLGWDFIERRLALQDPFPDVFIPNFCSVSGS